MGHIEGLQGTMESGRLLILCFPTQQNCVCTIFSLMVLMWNGKVVSSAALSWGFTEYVWQNLQSLILSKTPEDELKKLQACCQYLVLKLCWIIEYFTLLEIHKTQLLGHCTLRQPDGRIQHRWLEKPTNEWVKVWVVGWLLTGQKEWNTNNKRCGMWQSYNYIYINFFFFVEALRYFFPNPEFSVLFREDLMREVT